MLFSILKRIHSEVKYNKSIQCVNERGNEDFKSEGVKIIGGINFEFMSPGTPQKNCLV